MKYDSDEGYPNLSRCLDCWDRRCHTCQDKRVMKLNGGKPKEITNEENLLDFPDWCPLKDVKS